MIIKFISKVLEDDMENAKKGVICDWFETGCEGVVWTFSEDGKRGWDSFNMLEAGDHLRVWDENGKVIFDGVIRPDYKIGWEPYPKNRKHGQPAALGYWIHWTQKGWKPDDWARLFIKKENEPYLKAELIIKSAKGSNNGKNPKDKKVKNTKKEKRII